MMINNSNGDGAQWSLQPNKNYFESLSEILTDSDLIYRIRKWVNSSWVEVIQQACITIGYFVKNNVEISEKLNDYKIIDDIIAYITYQQTDEINRMALWCIYNIWQKYLPLTEKVPKKKEEDEVYQISFKLAQYMFQTEITPENISCHWYVILSFSYTLDHIVGYSEETKWIWDHIVNLVKNSSDNSLVNWWFIAMTRAIQNDSKYATLFSLDSEFWSKCSQMMIDSSDPARLSWIIRFLHQMSICGQLNIDSHRFSTLNFSFNMGERQGKDIVKMLINHINTVGWKSLLSSVKDFMAFVFSSINNFINRDDKIIRDVYYKDNLTLDIEFFLKSWMLLESLSKEMSKDQFETHLSENIVCKLEDTVKFLYDCYTQWEEDYANISFGAHPIDNVFDAATKLLIVVLKHIYEKSAPLSSLIGFSRDQGLRNAHEKLMNYIDVLESKINPNYQPVASEEHKFVDSEILCRIYDEITKNTREFLMQENTKVYELISEICKTFNMNDALIHHIDHKDVKTTINSDEALNNALQYSYNYSMDNRLERITFDIILDKDPGYWFDCKHWRKDFWSLSKYGNNDYWEDWSSYYSRNNRSRTPLVERGRSGIGSTPNQRSRIGERYGNTTSTRYVTPTRQRSSFY